MHVPIAPLLFIIFRCDICTPSTFLLLSNLVIVLQWSCQQCVSCWGQSCTSSRSSNPDMSHVKGPEEFQGFSLLIIPCFPVFISIWWNGGPGQHINYDLYFNQSKAWWIYVEGVRDIWVATGRRPCLWSYIPGQR